MAVAEVPAARGHHVGHKRAVGPLLVQAALDCRELLPEMALGVLPLEAVDEVPGVDAIPLDAHAPRHVQPVAGGLAAVLVDPDEAALHLAYVVGADVAAPAVADARLGA